MARVFVVRSEMTKRHGLIDAASIPQWKRKGWPLPPQVRCAIRVAGYVYEAEGREVLHADVVLRCARHGIAQDMGRDFINVELGFTVEE